MPNRTFTIHQLEKYNGKHGSPSYIAYRGIVYDVSRSFLWQNGKHQVIHKAGADLTGYLTEAPHGPEMLYKFPVVGMLV